MVLMLARNVATVRHGGVVVEQPAEFGETAWPLTSAYSAPAATAFDSCSVVNKYKVQSTVNIRSHTMKGAISANSTAAIPLRLRSRFTALAQSCVIVDQTQGVILPTP